MVERRVEDGLPVGGPTGRPYSSEQGVPGVQRRGPYAVEVPAGVLRRTVADRAGERHIRDADLGLYDLRAGCVERDVAVGPARLRGEGVCPAATGSGAVQHRPVRSLGGTGW